MIPGTSSELDALMAFVEGDTWSGIPSIAITVDGTPPASDLASARIQFRPSNNSRTVSAELSSSDATQLNITSANNWTMVVPEQTLDLKAGEYVWALETTNAAGDIQTYLKGTMNVQVDITK